MSKETAFHPRLQAMTDQWMDLFGYWAPLVVTDTLEEYRACREAAALMDFTMLRKVDIDGPGALAFVNGIVTRDVSTLDPGPDRLRGALRRGRQDDRRLHGDGALRRRASASAARTTATSTSSASWRRRASTVTEITDATPHLCLQGPLSRDMLQRSRTGISRTPRSRTTRSARTSRSPASPSS